MAHAGRDSGIGEEFDRANLLDPKLEVVDEDDEIQIVGEVQPHEQEEQQPQADVEVDNDQEDQEDNAQDNEGGEEANPSSGNSTDSEAESFQSAGSAVQNMAGAVGGSQLQTIPLFNGEESAFVIRNFCSAVDRAALQFDWNDNRIVPAAQSRLTDQAQTWLRGQLLRGKVWNHWEDQAAQAAVVADAAAGVAAQQAQPPQEGFKTALLIRFGKVITPALAVDAVQDLKQRHDETVSRFFDRVLLALDRKNSTQFTEAEKAGAIYLRGFNNDLTTFFLGGLKPAIRLRVLGTRNPPGNPDEALEAAKAAEAEEEKSRKIPFQANAVNRREREEVQEEIDEITGEVLAVRRQVICFRCGGKGHFQADCPTPAEQGQRRGGWRNQQQQPGARRGGRQPARGAGGGAGGGKPPNRQRRRRQVNSVEAEEGPDNKDEEPEDQEWQEETSDSGNE